MVRIAPAMVAMLIFAGCLGGSESDSNDSKSWKCSEYSGSDRACSCKALKPDWETGGSGIEVSVCTDYPCCLLNTQETDSTYQSCECLENVTSCADEAKSRRNTEVVSECPPPDQQGEPAPRAALGENCRRSYLSKNGLEGCAEGLICQPNSSDIWVCQTATAEQIALAKQCARSASNKELSVIAATVSTDLGTFEFDTVQYTLGNITPDGCLNDIRVTLRDAASSASCSLELDVIIVGDKLQTTLIMGSFSGCAGYTGPAYGGMVLETIPPPLISRLLLPVWHARGI